MQNKVEEVKKIGLLPSVELAQTADAVLLADALIKAGVPCVDLAYNAQTAEALALLARERPEFIAGVRVSSRQEADAALLAGAAFITGKGDFCTLDDASVPGGRVTVSALVVASRDWAAIIRLVNEALLKFLDFGLRHVGINSKNEEESSATASAFERIFGLKKEDRGGAYFAGDIIEVMKKPFYGTHGHIAISTADAGCAARYLEACGVKFNWNSAGYNPDGRLRVVYLQDEIGGFAVHILQK